MRREGREAGNKERRKRAMRKEERRRVGRSQFCAKNLEMRANMCE